MNRIIITGATGFLGGALARDLARDGAEVIGLGRDPAKLAALRQDRVTAFPVDLGQVGAEIGPVAEKIGAADALVHCAALSSAWGPLADFKAANVEGTRTAIALARAAGVRRFVQISTPSVYFAPRDQIAVTEAMRLPRPVNAYAATKAEAETLAWVAGDICPVILRPRGIYGAGDTALLPRLLDAARRGPLPLMRGGAAEIDLTHVDDVVAAIRAVLDAPEEICGETFNISSGEPRAVREIVEAVARATETPVRWQRVPWRVALTAAWASEALSRSNGPEPRLTRYKVGLFAFRQSLDVSKARRMLGWSPQVDFDAGLARTMVRA